jgi:hypothetical protein
MKDDEQVTFFLEKFLRLRNQLIGARVPYSNEELTLQLLCVLPKFYRSFVSSMGNQPSLTFDQLYQALKKEEIILGGTSSNSTISFDGNYKKNFTKMPYKTQRGKNTQSDNLKSNLNSQNQNNQG